MYSGLLALASKSTDTGREFCVPEAGKLKSMVAQKQTLKEESACSVWCRAKSAADMVIQRHLLHYESQSLWLFSPGNSHVRRGNLGSHSRNPNKLACVRDGMLSQATGRHHSKSDTDCRCQMIKSYFATMKLVLIDTYNLPLWRKW